jgi:hypothetical protein
MTTLKDNTNAKFFYVSKPPVKVSLKRYKITNIVVAARLTKQLHEDYGLDLHAAKWAVGSWVV